MATARVPRFCALVSSFDSFISSSPSCLLLPLRSHIRPTNHRTRTARKHSQLAVRPFSATAASHSEPVAPLRQEAEAKAQRDQTLREHEPTASHTTPEENTAGPASSKPSPETNASTTKRSRSPPTSNSSSSSDLDFLTTSRRITGTVIRTHTMAKTVAVSTNRQYFDRSFQKHYTKASKTLVHDPNETLVQGDVIEYGVFPPVERAERIKSGKGKRVKYVVRDVVTPFGIPLNKRVPRGGAGRKVLDS